jgi:rubredoxin
MTTVISFEEAKKAREPHCSGVAFCIVCDHTWAAVAPHKPGEVVDQLECPECHRHAGRFKFEFAPTDEQVWTCNCGNQLFNKTPSGLYCPACGSLSRDSDL